MNVPNGTCALGKKGCFTEGKCYYNRNCENKVVTNADRIRAMSDEELCEMLTIGTGGFDCGVCRDSNECDRECELHCAEWLKQPVKDGEDDAV